MFNILQGRTLRLSALSAANDSLEGRVFSRTFRRLAQQSKLPAAVCDVASIVVEGYAGHTDGFAFCLSENGDLLSQWRAYAEDGSGMALGFKKKALSKDFGDLAFGSRFWELVKVSYGDDRLTKDAQALVERLTLEFGDKGDFVQLRSDVTREEALSLIGDREANIEGIFSVSRNEDYRTAEKFLEILAKLPLNIYSAKTDSFREECEWRLTRYRHRASHPEIKFASDQMRIKPFIECPIAEPVKMAIDCLVLGPRNQSDIDWVRVFLVRCGMPHVTVSRSTITSYR